MKKLFLAVLIFLIPASAFAALPIKDPRVTQEATPFVWEWRFNAGIADECFGNETCPANWGVYTSYLDAQRYQCVTGGEAVKIRVLSPSAGTNSGTVRMGIYSDNSGSPNALLWEGTAQSYVAGTWIEEAVSGVTLVAETWYWLAFQVSTNTAELCYVPGGPSLSHRWLSNVTYANPFPDPWSGGSSNTNQYSIQVCVAGGVSDTYSGKFPRGIGRGIIR